MSWNGNRNPAPAPEPQIRQTKILATLGPASSKPNVTAQLVKAGVDAFRLNCSHSGMVELKHSVKLIRQTAAHARKALAIVMDLQGPRLRVGRLRNAEPVTLRKGGRVRITTHDVPGTETEISTNFRKLPRVVAKGSPILLDEGSIVLSVTRTTTSEVDCEIVQGGLLKEHKGINLPGADIDMPSLTPKDKRDLEMGIQLGIDHVALSFVREADDILRVRRMVMDAKSPVRIIAKIEHPLAIQHIDSILDAADGIMVARGDLAVELTAADVPTAQKLLVRKANEAGKTVIVATQMLDSMISRPNPTRAEASDVANAIFDGADVVMLSGETAVGQHPVEAVSIMSDIIRKAEASPFRYTNIPKGLTDSPRTGFAHALARASHDACRVTGAKAVVVFTLTGWSARVMSKYRPESPIYALTPLKETRSQLALYWGVTPLLCPLNKSTDAMIAKGESILTKAGYLRHGETILITAGGTAKHKASNMLKIHVLGSHTYR